MKAKQLTGGSNESESVLADTTACLSSKTKKKEKLKCLLGHLGHTGEKC